MINQLSMWQMVVDLCLVTSILIFALRFARQKGVPASVGKTIELEASLRKLISEAEVAGRHLNEQLLRREQNIHKYLGDIERHEKELSLSIVEAEGLTKDLSAVCERAQRVVKEFPTEGPSKSPGSTETSSFIPGPKAEEIGKVREEVAFSTKSKSPRASEWLDEGDITVAADAPSRSPVQMLQELYGRAETMLKNGQDLERVSQATKLPVEGIKRLAEMIEIERAEEDRQQNLSKQAIPKDPRLGALGMARRQSTTS